MLNPDSPIPLYIQLSDLILSRIRSGTYAPGSKIPSEHKLAQACSIGRPTVRQAIDTLVRKQLLTRKRGSGTFVCEKSKEVDLFSLAGTLSAFEKKGIRVKTRTLKKIKKMEIKKDPENPFSGRAAFFLSRLTLAEETPVLLENLYLDPDLFAGIEHIDLSGRSLSQVAQERFYMKPSGGKQNFRLFYSTEKKSGLFGIAKGDPLLLVKRFINFAQAKNAVFAELFCRTDQFVFSQVLGDVSNGQ